jgi:pyridoxine/pyridoxamine 5'-phosphate oxidase
VSNLRIRPILSISLVTPEPTKTAQTWIADAITSGYESAAKAGVKAAALGTVPAEGRPQSRYLAKRQSSGDEGEKVSNKVDSRKSLPGGTAAPGRTSMTSFRTTSPSRRISMT